jgi:hypothetical protein
VEAGIEEDLKLHDARGTAATNMLRMGVSLHDLAIIMGWSLRHASNVVESYAAMNPELSSSLISESKKR